jgi:hypothetical protein
MDLETRGSEYTNGDFRFDSTEIVKTFESLYDEKKGLYEELLNITGHDFGEESVETLNTYYDSINGEERKVIDKLLDRIDDLRTEQINLLDYEGNEELSNRYASVLIDEAGRLGFGGIRERSMSSILKDTLKETGQENEWTHTDPNELYPDEYRSELPKKPE